MKVNRTSPIWLNSIRLDSIQFNSIEFVVIVVVAVVVVVVVVVVWLVGDDLRANSLISSDTQRGFFANTNIDDYD